jgi:ATP-dependent Clp protease adaptor protein ClpS
MSDSKTSTNTTVAVIERVIMAPPRRWQVWLYNDDTTTMEFVVLVLMQIFHRSFEDAQGIMMSIHTNGKGIAGVYSHEIASQKKDETLAVARGNGFPLRVEITPEDDENSG